MKKYIPAFLIGLVIGFITFWGPSVLSHRFGTDKIFLYSTLNSLFLGSQILVLISYLIIGMLGAVLCSSLARAIKKEVKPFPVVAILLFSVGFVLPIILLGWAVAAAFSRGF